MEEYAFINAAKLADVCMQLDGAEIKYLLSILYYLSNKNKDLFINNAESREYFVSIGLAKSPERISTILSSLVKKGILKREANAVFTVNGDLYRKIKDYKMV